MTSIEELGIEGLTDIEPLDIEGSAIYRARQPRHNRTVAIKILDPNQEPLVPRRFDLRRLAVGQSTIQRFALQPGVVSLYELGTTTDGDQYVMTPYFRIGSLADQLDHGPMPWHRAAELVRRTADIVAEAHRINLVLADLKPSSIMLADASSPMVSMYGMATRRYDDGRPSYAAPEAARGQTPTPAADVYSLTLVLAALIAGQPPNRGPLSREFLAEVEAKAPARVVDIVRQGLAESPGARYRSAEVLSMALSTAINGEVSGPSTIGAAPTATPNLDDLFGPPPAPAGPPPPGPADAVPPAAPPPAVPKRVPAVSAVAGRNGAETNGSKAATAKADTTTTDTNRSNRGTDGGDGGFNFGALFRSIDTPPSTDRPATGNGDNGDHKDRGDAEELVIDLREHEQEAQAEHEPTEQPPPPLPPPLPQPSLAPAAPIAELEQQPEPGPNLDSFPPPTVLPRPESQPELGPESQPEPQPESVPTAAVAPKIGSAVTVTLDDLPRFEAPSPAPPPPAPPPPEARAQPKSAPESPSPYPNGIAAAAAATVEVVLSPEPALGATPPTPVAPPPPATPTPPPAAPPASPFLESDSTFEPEPQPEYALPPLRSEAPALGTAIRPDDELPFRAYDHHRVAPAPSSALARVFDPIQLAWLRFRRSLGAVLAFAGFAAIAGIVALLLVRDLQQTSTTDSTVPTSTTVEEDDSVTTLSPTSEAPVFQEPPVTHQTTTTRRIRRTTASTASTTSTTAVSTTAAPTTAAPTTAKPTTTEEEEEETTTTRRGRRTTTTADDEPPPDDDDDSALAGPPLPLIQNPSVSRIRATTADVRFSSSLCVTAAFAYSGDDGTSGEVPAGNRCSFSHVLRLGAVTDRLRPGTTYTVTVTATDERGRRSVLELPSFTTVG